MSSARGLANQKLYHAAILIRMLGAELAREELPAARVLEAVGLAVRRHLLEAYGWFLLELADVSELPAEPPSSIAELEQRYGRSDPRRGELVELERLEGEGWLASLLAPPGRSRGSAASRAAGTAASGDLLAVAEQAWSREGMALWHDSLAELIDQMGHGLDEW
ncbi:MAG: DUF6586 family protein [Halieaceae bacterium]|nr:DUF6586 family protein [Halieaceae bacterium]